MQRKKSYGLSLFVILALLFSSCSYSAERHAHRQKSGAASGQISPPGEKVIIINPRTHVFGAYTASGKLVLSGTATAGAYYCPDISRGCKTRAGSFRIYTLGSASCKSSKYPLPKGGAPMPYCMFFNGHQGIHGSHQVVKGNISHGCVRVTVSNAAWLRYNFVEGPHAGNGYRGTRVIVLPY
jgi:hypothetical protein